MTCEIRRLTPGDADAFVEHRRAMLGNAPLAFMSSPTDDLGCDVAIVRSRLAGGPDNVIIGAFESTLVGSAGLVRVAKVKGSHGADLWGMYVAPEHRGRGLGRRILDAVLAHARTLDGVTQVKLGVTEAAPEARSLYESVGFRTWGVEPRAVRHGGRSVAESHMVLFLDGDDDAS